MVTPDRCLQIRWMTPRQNSLKLGSPARVAVFAILIGVCAFSPSPSAYADDPKAVPEASGDSQPVRTSAQPPAKFFTINGVLEKLDRAQGRGKGAIRLASLRSASTAMDARSLPTQVSSGGKEPFGLFTFRAPEGSLSRKWRGLQSDLTKEEKVLERCRADAADCPAHAAQFLRLINAIKTKSGRAQLEEANRGVNAAIRFVSDYAQYGEADRWSAPLATFATAKGDCEDYAFAKYVALRAAGFPSDDLRVIMGRDRTVRQDHAVLAARLDGRWLILDSQRAELIEYTRVPDLTPVFAIDNHGVLLRAASYE